MKRDFDDYIEALAHGLTEDMIEGMTQDELELFKSGLIDELIGDDFNDVDFDPDEAFEMLFEEEDEDWDCELDNEWEEF